MEMTYTHAKKVPDFINKQMDKGSLKKLLGQMYLEFGGAKEANLADALKSLGYKYATISGTTISIADLSVPPAGLWLSAGFLPVPCPCQAPSASS